MPNNTKQSPLATGTVALAVTWEAKPGEANAFADILARMAKAVEAEPGTLAFLPHRSPANDHIFFLYERFTDEAAFAAHQKTEHFQTLVLDQGLPKLARRERLPFTPLSG